MLLLRTSEALQFARTRTSKAALARIICRDRSVLSKSRKLMKDWNGEELCRLLAVDGEFRTDFIAALTDQVDEHGKPLEAESDLRDLIRVSARSTDVIMSKLEGGLSADEARECVPLLKTQMEAMQRTMRDCEAKARTRKGR